MDELEKTNKRRSAARRIAELERQLEGLVVALWGLSAKVNELERIQIQNDDISRRRYRYGKHTDN